MGRIVLISALLVISLGVFAWKTNVLSQSDKAVRPAKEIQKEESLPSTEQPSTPSEIAPPPPSSPKISSPAPKIETQTQKDVRIISPANGATYKKGDVITIEAYVNDKKKYTKVEFGAGILNKNFPLIGTVTNKPYKISYHLPSDSASDPYNYVDNKITIIAYAYEEGGNYTTDTITLKVTNPAININIISPSEGTVYTSHQTIEVKSEISGDVSKVEYILGSGQIDRTFEQPPYRYSLDLAKYASGITARHNIPFEVKAYDNSGNYTSKSLTLQVDP